MVLVVRADQVVLVAVMAADPAVAVAADPADPAAVDLEVDLGAAASVVPVADAADLAVVHPDEAVVIVARAKADAAALPAVHHGSEIVVVAANKVSAERRRSQCATRPWTQNLIPSAAPTSPRPIIRNCGTASVAVAL